MTAPPPAVAALVAAIVHVVGFVWVIAVIVEIPVRLKSTPAVADSVAQSRFPVPVTVNRREAVGEVATGVASVAVRGTAI